MQGIKLLTIILLTSWKSFGADEVPFCRVTQDPSQFKGKTVTLEAAWISTQEALWLTDPKCKDLLIGDVPFGPLIDVITRTLEDGDQVQRQALTAVMSRYDEARRSQKLLWVRVTRRFESRSRNTDLVSQNRRKIGYGHMGEGVGEIVLSSVEVLAIRPKAP